MIIYIEIFSIGLLYGLTYCGIVCAPYVATYIIGSDKGFWNGVSLTVTFSFGRLIAYAILGALAVNTGLIIMQPEYLKYMSTLFGIAIIIIGLYVCFRKKINTCLSSSSENKKQSWIKKKLYNVNSSNMLTIGFLIGLIPCPPLIAILMYLTMQCSIVSGVVLALLFGLGTILSPLIIVGGVAGWFSKNISEKAPIFSPWIKRICGIMLILLGVQMIISIG